MYSAALVVLVMTVMRSECNLLYNVTYASSSSPQPSWAVPHQGGPWVTSSATGVDDNSVFDNTEFCMPFFSLPNATMYISSNGFLSVQPVAPCNAFCTATVGGPYTFTMSTGGAWPVVGLYVADLDPSAQCGSTSTVIERRTFSIVDNDGLQQDALVVRYVNVCAYSITQQRGGSVNAEVEMWSNGTIIMRYASVITLTFIERSVGLVLSPKQRVVADVPLARGGAVDISAIRFEAYNDPCNAALTRGACMSTGCAWCANAPLCVSSSIAVEFCGNDAGVETPRYASTVVGAPFSELGPTRCNTSSTLTLPFPFPLYYNPPSALFDPTSANLVRSLSVSPLGVTAQGSRFDRAIYALNTSSFLPTSTTLLCSWTFPPRPQGTDFCFGSDCPASVVIQYSGVPLSTFASPYLLSWQIILSADGRIEVNYGPTLSTCSAWVPFPTAGLPSAIVLNSRDNTLIPWVLASNAVSLRYTPAPWCVPCASGTCNVTSRQCLCDEGFGGVRCDECLEGRYGALCTPCPTCLNGGTCEDGNTGNGICTCPSPFSGPECAQICDVTTSCPGGCGSGYCNCGTCKCNTTLGFSGPQCEVWNDPSLQYTLDGCGVCTDHNADAGSLWCSPTSLCYTDIRRFSLRSFVPQDAIVTCAGFSFDNRTRCPDTNAIRTPSSSFLVFAIMAIAFGLSLCSCLLLCLACMCRGRDTSPLVLQAASGIIDHDFNVRREREVVRITMLPAQGVEGRPVLGVPLKVMPLKDLVEFQRGMRSREAAPV